MDMDTAVFLDICERQAEANQSLEGYGKNEITEDQVLIALMVASVDILGQSTPSKVANGFDYLRDIASQVEHIAEENGFTIIHEEGR